MGSRSLCSQKYQLYSVSHLEDTNCNIFVDILFLIRLDQSSHNEQKHLKTPALSWYSISTLSPLLHTGQTARGNVSSVHGCESRHLTLTCCCKLSSTDGGTHCHSYRLGLADSWQRQQSQNKIILLFSRIFSGLSTQLKKALKIN